MPSRKEILWFTGLIAVSLGVHAAAVGAIGRNGAAARGWKAKAPTMVTMEVAAPKPPPPPPPEPAAPKPVAHRVPVARPARAHVAAPRPAEAPPPPEAETPADFTGVTLTNNGPGPGWASAAGNGEAMRGPIGTPGARVTGRSAAGAPGGDAGPGPSGPPVLKLADLSQPPRAPQLDDVLERNYPQEARKRGVQGQAVLRVRVMPDGHVRDLLVVAESGGGFGEACKRTLRASVWSPPLDQSARPVSTFVSYTCRFEVR